MENGKIKDNQVTASSSRPADLPHYGRLNNGKYWCAGKADKNQYFQVDLGQVRKWKPVSCFRPFPSCQLPLFQSEAKGETSHMKTSFHSLANKTYFRIKVFTPDRALK